MNADIKIPVSGGDHLVGTFVGADGASPSPAALILSGSGPLDRNSNMPGQAVNISNTIAIALEEAGVSSLRFDKRGVGASTGDYMATGFPQETDDAMAALAVLTARPEVDGRRRYVIGHSVGGTIAIRLAAQNSGLAGAVLLCTAARSGETVMRRQTERIADSMKGIRRLASGWFRRSQERTLRILADPDADASSLRLPGLSATWLREFIQYDPGHDLARVGCPVLAITGAKDIQVEASDVSRIGALVENGFTGLTPESITHLLRTDPGPVGLKSYRAQMRRPIDPDLLATITSWVTADRAI